MSKISTKKKAALDKAIEKLEKKKSTLERHKKQADKKLAEINKKGYEPNNKYCRKDTREHQSAYSLICDYGYKLEDIERTEKTIKDQERIIQKHQEAYKKALKKESTIERVMPEIFRTAQKQLENDWTEWDVERQKLIRAQYDKMGYKEFMKKYSYRDYEFLNCSYNDIRKENFKSAEAWIINLYNRVKAVTGEVTDCSKLHLDGNALNGFVTGKEATVEVETIVAGGYNIQKMHYRTLVKPIK